MKKILELVEESRNQKHSIESKYSALYKEVQEIHNQNEKYKLHLQQNPRSRSRPNGSKDLLRKIDELRGENNHLKVLLDGASESLEKHEIANRNL